MANIFEKKDRHVIPNWRSFENTVKLRELNGSHSLDIDISFKPDISDILDDWNYANNIGVAGDIIGTAIICNQQDNLIVREVAEFVRNNEQSTPAMVKAANSILFSQVSVDNLSFEIANTNEAALQYLRSKIHAYKQKLRNNPSNPIAWVEISRLYSINGQEKQAEKAMKNALFLAPENRFVLRTMARFFIHLGDIDFAHENLRKKNITKHDPWLMATEIATADLRGRHSALAQKGIQIITSDSFHPFNISELSSAIATIEMSFGNSKKSRTFFHKSLISPNDNSLAQAEWASQEDSSLFNGIDPITLNNTVGSFEALALDYAEHAQWQKAIDYSKQWFLDLPFSKRSVLFGNHIAITKLKDQKQAIEIAQMGLLSHPNDPQLLNNIAYSFCLDNNIYEAEKYLNMVRSSDIYESDSENICLTATKGLLSFRKNDFVDGREKYMKAIELAKNADDEYLVSLAFVNLAREEIRINSVDSNEYLLGLKEIKERSPHKDLRDMAEDIYRL
jgi:tetratricopeptide (TPR) repeat protein